MPVSPRFSEDFGGDILLRLFICMSAPSTVAEIATSPHVLCVVCLICVLILPRTTCELFRSGLSVWLERNTARCPLVPGCHSIAQLASVTYSYGCACEARGASSFPQMDRWYCHLAHAKGLHCQHEGAHRCMLRRRVATLQRTRARRRDRMRARHY